MSLPILVAYHFPCLVYVLHTCCIRTMLNEGPLLSDVASLPDTAMVVRYVCTYTRGAAKFGGVCEVCGYGGTVTL